jgi:hypothetical protein
MHVLVVEGSVQCANVSQFIINWLHALATSESAQLVELVIMDSVS